ncbi:MAG: SusD/RagB family nutrient-binding outer membrane lipoprotein [Saprospiraceae bacterium]|nr:SusD/RagB family nutrient-binding outer membrane lipoprotein [Saprospiraceae bacterium]
MKSIKNTIIIILLLSIFSCQDKLDEISTNPNASTEATPELLLPQIIRDAMNALTLESWNIGSLVIQHTAKCQNVAPDRYVWTERDVIWNAVYDNLRDVQNIITLSEASGENNYKGIALVLRAWLFSLATDCYGDVPYSEAIKAKEGINYPKYDPQEQIYQGILQDLKEANELLDSSGNIVNGDVLYLGDVQKWRKLANSLRIRYLIRISGKMDVSADLQAITNNPDSTPIFESNIDNAVFNYRSTPPDQFPIHILKTGNFNEFRASKGLLELMVEYEDERLDIFYRPTPATEGTTPPQYAGIPNGLSDDEALAYNGGLEHQSRIGRPFYEDAILPNGLQAAKGVMMTYSELQFLLAEAAERGMITGAADKFYRQGIAASFTYYGLNPEKYLSGGLANYTGPSEEKLKQIGFQKWIALYMQGLEAWFDWRRTRNPELLPAESNQNNDQIPLRFPYPRIEQSLNARSYQEAVARQGADDLNTKIWYLKD